jgi:hypothetical protein
MAKKKIPTAKNIIPIIPEEPLFKELSLLIEKSKQKAVSQVKSTVNMLFWQIGKRINDEILHNKRAVYGTQVMANLAEKLSLKYGCSFELRNLRRMMQFAGEFPNKKIVSTLSTQLNWFHIILMGRLNE